MSSGPRNFPILTTDCSRNLGVDAWHVTDAKGDVVSYIDQSGAMTGFTVSESGLGLTDIQTGKQFQLQVTNGVLQLVELT